MNCTWDLVLQSLGYNRLIHVHKNRPQQWTLGVVRVVGLFVADATNFEGPKAPNFIEKPPFLFVSEQSRMSSVSMQAKS